MTQDEFKKVLLDEITSHPKTTWIPYADACAIVDVTFETLKKLSEEIK